MEWLINFKQFEFAYCSIQFNKTKFSPADSKFELDSNLLEISLRDLLSSHVSPQKRVELCMKQLNIVNYNTK